MRYVEIKPKPLQPTPTNAAPGTTAAAFPVEPTAVKHGRWQRLQSVKIAQSAARVKPTELDAVKAFLRYSATQSAADGATADDPPRRRR